MTKILIDEAVVRLSIYATAMVVDIDKLEDWQLELHEKATADLSEALRQALANEALDKMADNARELGIGLTDDGKFFCDGKSCKQSAQQEPVQYQRREIGEGGWMDCTKEQYEKARALPEWDTRVITTPQPAQQEPVAHCKVRPLQPDESMPKVDVIWAGKPVPGPLYTTPQAQPAPAQEPDPDELTIAYMSGVYEGKKRKPWVGLTREEIDDIEATWEATEEWVSFSHATRVIEAKLKEKNT